MSTPPRPPSRYALQVVCRSAAGQVAAMAALIERHGGYVEEFAVHDDRPSERFFLRAVFRRAESAESAGTAATALATMRADLDQVAPGIQALHWRLHDLAQRPRVLLMVSRLEHCLVDLLTGWRRGELAMDPVGVVSNHEELRGLAEAAGLPFTYLPITADTKAAQEARLLELVRQQAVDFVVLARYMQVLSDGLCAQLAGRILNIHHGLLPAFKGARPYHQAFERGVKLIGATAHFATPDLDEGPIIAQATESVDHAQSPEDLLDVGRRLECTTLSRALRSVLEHRVFINGQRTVVLK
ncbi:formyltetrahydrofolate deformylase [Ideonella livida]|uniref:Formyltetrahydrofolate deformylase n=1 Tax=Ideonella livida TaxID=2707176 RepID=A0A7C9TJ20_9BURK|nr:formyltetrahydrofolate deformylase [Ideonella livida]NDY91779.1 formyltetrahydrofolate deformylase [Ideonella livida]